MGPMSEWGIALNREARNWTNIGVRGATCCGGAEVAGPQPNTAVALPPSISQPFPPKESCKKRAHSLRALHSSHVPTVQAGRFLGAFVGQGG